MGVTGPIEDIDVSPSETPSGVQEPSDPVEAEMQDDASLTSEEDRLLEDLDRAASLHDADVGSLEDAFVEESQDDARTID